MKEKIIKLIDVKTIVTFALTAVYVYLCVTDHIKSEVFMTVYTTVIGMYFGTQYQKHKQNKEAKEINEQNLD